MIRKHHKFMMSFTLRFLTGLKRPVFAYLVTLSLTVQMLFAAVFYFIERGTNSQVQSFFDSLYFTVTVMTGVGLGDLYPITVAGKAVSMMMMLMGTALFVCFTAVLSASILEVEADNSTTSS